MLQNPSLSFSYLDIIVVYMFWMAIKCIFWIELNASERPSYQIYVEIVQHLWTWGVDIYNIFSVIFIVKLTTVNKYAYIYTCTFISSFRETPPKDILRRTLLKSAHVYKKHRVQYEIKTHFKIFKVLVLVLSIIQYHHPLGYQFLLSLIWTITWTTDD